MSCDWNKIGEEISSLYEKMEYRPEYNIEKFESDLKIEKEKEYVSIRRFPKIKVHRNSRWISVFGDVLESRRSILTKLFSFTNNPNGVDMLIEYCDYYNSYYEDNPFRNTSRAVTIPAPKDMMCSVFIMMAKNETTERVIESVWEMICTDTAVHTPLRNKNSPVLPGAGSQAMVIMADSDLNAAVLALARSRHTYFEVSTVLVQEPVKEQLFSTIKNYGFTVEILSSLYVFHNIAEALGNLNSKKKLAALSIWSENITAAKKISENAQIDTIWINTHGVLGPGLDSMISGSARWASEVYWISEDEKKYESQKTPIETSKTYDLFYGGKWHSAADGKYWTNETGVSFAVATDKDASSCAKAAREGFRIWRSKKLSQRAKIIRSFAERLQANGEFECADIVLQLVDHPLTYGTWVSLVRDGEAEIITKAEPVGVVAIDSNDQKTLFAKLTIASVTGNAVIVLLNRKSSLSFVSYCDLLGTCGFPPGVINCLFIDEPINYKIVDAALPENIQSLNSEPYEKLCNKFLTYVTKPKSVWLQCA